MHSLPSFTPSTPDQRVGQDEVGPDGVGLRWPGSAQLGSSETGWDALSELNLRATRVIDASRHGTGLRIRAILSNAAGSTPSAATPPLVSFASDE